MPRPRVRPIRPLVVACLAVATFLVAPAPGAQHVTAQESLIRSPVPSVAWGDCPLDLCAVDAECASRHPRFEEHLGHLENGHHFVVPDASHWFSFNPRSAPCVAELISQFPGEPGRRPDGSCLDELGPRRLLSASETAR